MASSSLNRMTVPASDSDPGGSILMPKLQYRFRVLFTGFGGESTDATELTKQVIDVSRPTVTFPEINVPIYNSRFYLAGKPEWNAISINIRDDAQNRITELVGRQIQAQFDFSEQASAAAGVDYKFTMYIQILDGGNGNFTPVALETYELYGCFIQSANYQTLNYGSNEVVTVQLNIRYDNAVQTSAQDGDATGIGRAVGNRLAGTLSTGSAPVPTST